MAVFNKMWEKAEANITKRGIFMFNSELLSDVSLVVRASSDEGESKKSKMAIPQIPAHKVVLSVCSPVFFAMFCGKMAEKSDSVDLPDCEYEGVLEMLRYMYSGKAELNQHNVMQVLYVAKKYILPSLVENCIVFLKVNVNTGNVFWVLSHAQQYDEKELVDQCWELIDIQTIECVQSEGFMTIERSLLEEIVKRDSLSISEVELFKAVDLWATKECQKQGLTPDGSVKRRIIGENIVKQIRFPVMEEKEFANIVLGSEILTPNEGLDIIKYFNTVTVVKSPVGSPEQQRVGTSFPCYRFPLVKEKLDKWHGWKSNYDKKECIDFKVDKDIKLYGIRMFGKKDEDFFVILKVTDTEDCIELEGKSGKFSSVRFQKQPLAKADFYGFDILFDFPVELEKDVRYCIGAIIDGSNSWFGKNGLSDVQCHDVKFSILDCTEKNRGDTGVKSGQFAAFLFRPQ